MIDLLVTLVPSVLWILYRCVRILSTPTKELMDDLQIEIPNSPTICIDCIQDNMAIIHWDVVRDDLLSYILVVDDLQVTRMATTSCKLTNLEVDKLYKIEIIAENSLTNFKNKSMPIYLQCLNEEIDDEVIEKNDDIIPVLNIDVDIEKVTIHEIKSITSTDILNDYLNSFQIELNRTNQEIANFKSYIDQETIELNKQLNLYKLEFDQEFDSKAKKDIDVKLIEKSKHELTYSKSKLNSQIATIQSSIDSYNNKLNLHQEKIDKLNLQKDSLIKNEKLEVDKIALQIDKINSKLLNNKKANQDIEDNLKQLINEKKDLSHLVNKLKSETEFINNPSLDLAASIFTKSGNIQKQVLESINRIYEIIPSWQADLHREIESYQFEDLKWKNTFKLEIKKFVNLQNSIELMKSNLDLNYQPNKITEYQASIDFGGFGNALPKPKSKTRNFTPPIDESNFHNHYEQVYSQPDNAYQMEQNHDMIDSIDRSFSPSNSMFQSITQPDIFGTPTDIYPMQNDFYQQDMFPANLQLSDLFLTPSISHGATPSIHNATNSISSLQQPIANINTPPISINTPPININSAPQNQYYNNYNHLNLIPKGDLNGMFYRLTSPELPNARLASIKSNATTNNQNQNTINTTNNINNAPATIYNPLPTNLALNGLFNNSSNVLLNQGANLRSTSPLPEYASKGIWNDQGTNHARNLSYEIMDNKNKFQPFNISNELERSRSKNN